MTVTAVGLLLSAGPAIADDDWIGPDPALCGGRAEAVRGFDVFLLPEGVFFGPQRVAMPCADTNDSHTAHLMN